MRSFSILLTFLTLLNFGFLSAQDAEVEEQGDSDLELAQFYYQNEEYEKALDYLKELLKQNNIAAYRPAFGSYMGLQEYKKAEKLCERYIQKQSGRTYVFQMDLLDLYQIEGDTKKQDELIAEIKLLVQKNAGQAYTYGKALQDNGYPQVALDIYQLAEAKNPKMNFDYNKALLYGELGEIRNMYDMYIKMIIRNQSYLRAVKVYVSQAINDSANKANVEYLKQELVRNIQEGAPKSVNDLLVHIYIQQKSFRTAFIQLKGLYRQKVVSLGEVNKLANVTANNKEYDLAKRIYEFVIDSDKEKLFYTEAKLGYLEASRYTLEANAETSKSEWQNLIQQYQATKDDFEGDYYYAALIFDMVSIEAYRLGNLNAAETLLKDLLKAGFVSKEMKAEAHILLGDLQLYKGDRWEAILSYTRAEKSFEQSTIGQEAKFKKAKAAYYVGDFEWAQSVFDVLKESTSKEIANDAMIYSLLIRNNAALDSNYEAMENYARADLFKYQGQMDSALYLLELMEIAHLGHDIIDECLLMKGDILYEQKKYALAEESWKEIVSNHKDDILADDALYRLANLNLEVFDNRQRAMDLYQQLFTDFIDSFYVPEARKKFRELRGDSIN